MKQFWNKQKRTIILGSAILAILAAVFFWGGNYPKPDANAQGETTLTELASPSGQLDASAQPVSPNEAESVPSETLPASGTPGQAKPAQTKQSAAPSVQTKKPVPSSSSQANTNTKNPSPSMQINPQTGKDRYQTNPAPAGKPVPVEPQDTAVTGKKLTCNMSVRCDTILRHMELLDEAKRDLVPEEGVIFPATAVSFYEGESVFQVLRREMKQSGIQMEFKNTPIYNSAYIEGIQNLYEFDVGDLSGWMYKVNGWFPNYGCSRYQIKAGDVIEWVYTCDLGKDVGGSNAAGGA